MTGKQKDYFKRVSKTVETQINKQSKAIADKLKPMMHSGDATSVTKAEWHQMIRSNWFNEQPVKIGDTEYPNWRAAQAFRVGPVKLVQDALEAHGLHKSLLNKNADAILHGMDPKPEHDATQAFGENMRVFHHQGKVPHYGTGGIITHQPTDDGSGSDISANTNSPV